MTRFFPLPRTAFLSALLLGSTAAVAAPSDREAMRFFENEIRPLLAGECYECHGPDKSKNGLRLDHRDLILEGGDSGAAVAPGDPEKSLLIEAVRGGDPDFHMPPKNPLRPDQVEALEQWVRLGAPWPDEAVTRSETDEDGFTAEDRDWWAIQPLADVDPPRSGDDWAKNPVDRFVARRLEEQDLDPAPPAGPVELVRRLHFDLHGLPPTPEEVASFTRAWEKDPDRAVADRVDRLLADPRYGERWAQHWLDVVRYAESDGYRADHFRPGTWRYRDYVIDSFNEDKPYDRFVREQLAADEFAPGDPEAVIATGFLRLGVYEWNQRNARMQRDLILTEMTNVTGEALLGVGIGCAQCHDHKFDPILQRDHYALRAFFESTWWPEHRPLATPEELAEHERRMAEWREATREIRSQIDEMTAPRYAGSKKGVIEQFPEDIQAIYRTPAEERTAAEEQLAQLVQRQIDHKADRLDFEKIFKRDEEKLARYRDLREKLKEYDELKPGPLPDAFVTTDVGPDPAVTTYGKGKSEKSVEPAFLTLLDAPDPEVRPTDDTTGRRTALADWIASEDNPLSTRVIVNRVWQHHFGSGIVATPNDFGTLGEPPSHPELLDWLTRRFLEGGWKLKPLHRLIATSATYRQTARRSPTSDETRVDSDNRLLWRYPPRRLAAEPIRDAMLSVSGELEHREGGPSVDGDRPHRSIYVKKKRNTKDPMIGGFDAPTGFGSAPERVHTTTPNQSLLLVNGEWALERAGAFADRLLDDGDPGPDLVRRAYRLAYGRDPSRPEVEAALGFLESQGDLVETSEPPAKYPDENGLRPVKQAFGGIEGAELGERGLWLQPGSRFERLEVPDEGWPAEAFTVEAVAVLDDLHPDASVNTLASRWNGSRGSVGWTFGVTSEKSAYDPRNFIVQLVGDDFQGNRVYEVVASNLRVPVGEPVYLAATISARPSADDPNAGAVTFYLKDLSDPDAPLQTKTVAHPVVGGLADDGSSRTLVGGRDQKGHLWDGQLARLAVTPGGTNAKRLLVDGGPSGNSLLDWTFAGENGEKPAPGTNWVRHLEDQTSSDHPPAQLGAVTDFCHALLSSNEFLYLH